MGNAELLSRCGFTVPLNPHNTVSIELGMLCTDPIKCDALQHLLPPKELDQWCTMAVAVCARQE